MPEEARTDVWVPEVLDFEEARELKKRTLTTRLLRYWWAWCVIHQTDPRPELVFDLGCGSGYGSRIMVEQHDNLVVCGLDSNEVALAVARQEFAIQGKTDFRRVNLDVEWIGQFYNMRPQVVVAFDLFERLVHRDAFLLYLSQMLPDSGQFLLSTENTLNRDTTFRPDAPLHICYARSDLLSLLRRFFRVVRVYGQQDFPGKDWLDQVNAKRRYPLGKELIACAEPFKEKKK